MKEHLKSYLGDSVYAESDGMFIRLTTENGMGPSNVILLDQDTIDALIKYIRVVIVLENFSLNEGDT